MEEKQRMSSGRWLGAFAATIALLAALVAGFNFVTDPFGAFGDRFLQWWSYDATLNPRVAKISYLEQHHEEYDSYIIGPSSTSSFPVESLNEYYGASFYNMIMYGVDMKDVELTAQYLLENYTVEHLVVNLYIKAAVYYDTESDPLTYGLHYKVDGSNPVGYYLKYLFSNPRNGWEKLQRLADDGYLQEPYRVFDEATGAYDKSRRDVEPIGDLEEYLQTGDYGVFRNYPSGGYEDLPELENCMASVERIKELCEAKGVDLLVVCPPLYYEDLAHYPQELQAQFRNALAQVTDYWDFSLSSVSYEPRYFYDADHFRNCVGEMALAKVFGDGSVYCPEDLGEYVPQGSTPGAPQGEPAPEESYTAQVPVLLYHNLGEESEGSDTMSTALFEEHLAALREAGYETVTLAQLQDYVETGAPLPEKPVVITFDDGYLSNYQLAWPLLEEYGMEAEIFVVGSSMGRDVYKDGLPMEPHFSLEQAQEMEASGVISIGSHGWNIHQVAGRDPEPVRSGILPLEGETEEDYIRFLREDCRQMKSLLGEAPTALAYPYGFCSELSERVLADEGIEITFTTQGKTNTLIKGMDQSLRQLGRHYMRGSVTAQDLLALLEG